MDAEAGLVARLASPDDAFAIVGAIVELASRQIRTKDPADIGELEPVHRAADPRARGFGAAARQHGLSSAAALASFEAEVTACRACPRLVEWREKVAREKRAAFRDQDVLGPPDPRLRRPRRARADPRARARRARRQPHRARVHGRPLGRLPLRRPAPHRLRQPAAPRCAATTASSCATASSPPACAARRRPTSRLPEERDALLALARARARPARDAAGDRLPRRVRLGGRAAHPGAGRRAAAPAPPALRARRRADAGRLLGCFHPSQQNTFTGKLTAAMIDDVLVRARALAEEPFA